MAINFVENEDSKALYFATTSVVKFDQYKTIFADLNISLRRGTAITSVLIEPQLDPSQSEPELSLIGHPLRQAARFAQKSNQLPYMIEDTMLIADAFSAPGAGSAGLPGGDTKSWWRNLGSRGILTLLKGRQDRGARFVCQIGIYLGQSTYRFVRSELAGTITDQVRVSEVARRDIPYSNPFYFHSIFQPLGSNLTLAEMDASQFQEYDYRRQCAYKLVDELGQYLQERRQLSLPFGD